VPVVLVEPTVVVSAEEDEVVEVGGAVLGPGGDVVDLQPSAVATAGVLALVSVAVVDEVSEPGRDLSAGSSDADDLFSVSDDPPDQAVAAESLCGGVGDERSVVQLGDTLVTGGERFEVGEDVQPVRGRV
jgi:hypothetical protein